jgi:Cyclin, N-terminal domain
VDLSKPDFIDTAASDFAYDSLASSCDHPLPEPTSSSFFSARVDGVVSLAKLQLDSIIVGMFLATKEEEIVAPSALNVLNCADSSYTEAEILQAEKYILKTLEWNMNYPNPIHFLRQVSKADEYNSDGQLDDQLCLETTPASILLQEARSKEIYEGTVFLSSLSCRVD